MRGTRRGFMAAAATSVLAPGLLPRRAWAERVRPKTDWGFPDGALRVGSNENPLGPSPLAVEAMADALRFSHRYARPQALVEAIARRHDVDGSWIVLGCGSMELLRHLPLAFSMDGEIVAAREAYRGAPQAAARVKVPVQFVPVDKDHRHDLGAMAKAVTDRTRVVLISNPNNPTGTVVPKADLLRFIAAVPPAVTVVIDEAYIHYTPEADVSAAVKERKNLLVLRTFSKVYGLAGLRIGYALGHPDLIGRLREHTSFFNINAVGFAGALAALDDTAHVERCRALMREGKEFWEKTLRARGTAFVRSEAPFFLAEAGGDADAVVRKLSAEKVYVRPGRDWDMPRHVRISFGPMDENRAVAAALEKALV
jgi:histidinol-phosphate aminotransferase